MTNQHIPDIIRMVASRTYVLLAGSILMVVLARWLNPEAFGQYQLILSLVSIFPIFVDWGISHSLPRYLAQYRGRDPGIVRQALNQGLRVKLIAVVVGALFLVVVRDPLVSLFHLNAIGHLLPLGLLILLGFSANEFFLKLSEGFQQFRAVPITTFVKNTGDLTISLGLVFLGFGLMGALVGKMVATGLAAGVGLTWLLRSAYRTYRNTSRNSGVWGSILTYGTWLIVIDVTERVFLWGDRLLINRFLGPEMVGIYSVSVRILMISQLLGLSVASVIGPAMGRDPEGSRPALRAGLRMLTVIYSLLAVLTLGLADRLVLLLFGMEYTESIPSLRVFALVLPMVGVSPVISLVLTYGGAAKQRVATIAVAMVITIAGNLLLIPRIGILGSAISLATGQAVYVIAQGLIFGERTRLPGFWPPLIVMTAIISLGSVGFIAGMRWLWPGDLAAWGAGAIASVGFVLGLIRWRLISPGELLDFLPLNRFRGNSS